MANMSYCRFENTLSDLQDCKNAMEGMADDPEEWGKLSKSESSARDQLIELCREITENAPEWIEGFNDAVKQLEED